MATQLLQFGYTSGQTLTVSLLALGADSFTVNSTATSESPASSGIYKATFVESPALNGSYRAVVLSSGVGVASYEVSFTGTDSEIVQSSEFVNVDLNSVWDAAMSSHNIGGSFGRAIRQMKEGLVVEEASVDDGAATTTSFITTLPKLVDDFYNDDTLVFISGDLIGQSRIISDYDGSELRVTFDEPLTSAPADTDEFILLAGHNLTLTQIQNTVWDAQTSDHQQSGSMGEAVSSSGGGDATLANQTAILAKLNTNPIEISNPLVDSSTLVLINHDNYSSNNSRLITFPVTTDYSSATNVKLIFETNGTNIKIASAVVASATSITVDLEVDFGSSLSFTDCSGSVCNQVATCDFALVASYSADEESIARGTAYIYNRAKEA